MRRLLETALLLTAALACLYRFGEGYKVTLGLTSDDPDVHAIASNFLFSLCPGARESTHVGAIATYMLPKDIDVADLFQRMEAHKSNVGVREWGLTQASLEEVFVKVVETAETESGAALV